jgi:hypothetical protein
MTAKDLCPKKEIIPRLYRFLKLQQALKLAYLSCTVPEVSKSNIKRNTLIRQVTGITKNLTDFRRKLTF